MKVLHIGNNFWPQRGGIEEFTMSLCLATQPLGIQNKVICLNRAGRSKDILPKTGEINQIEIVRIPFFDLKYYKPAWIPLEELKKADVIHLHGLSALSDFVVLTKWIHQKPIVVNTHGGLFHTSKIAGLKKLYFFGWQKQMLKAVDLVVADSKNDFELFKPIASRIAFLENGVDIERFSSLVEKPKQFNRFLFVARLSKNKRIDNLLKTFSELKKKGVGFELRIVGGDWQGIRTELEKLAKSLGIEQETVFTGEVSEHQLLLEYEKAAFFVSASEYEGFGISVIEAMASGCVCILNSIESFRHFAENEKNAFLVQFDKPTDAAKKIADTMQQNNEKIQKNGLKKAESFSWKSKAKEWKNIYEQLVQDHLKKDKSNDF